jgi:hypothetical protein
MVSDEDQCGREIGQPGAASAIGDDIQSEPVIRQVDVDGAGQSGGRSDLTEELLNTSWFVLARPPSGCSAR